MKNLNIFLPYQHVLLLKSYLSNRPSQARQEYAELTSIKSSIPQISALGSTLLLTTVPKFTSHVDPVPTSGNLQTNRDYADAIEEMAYESQRIEVNTSEN